MKSIFSLLLAFFITATLSFGQDNAIDKFFENYQDDEAFTSVYVSPKMFKMVSKVAGDETNSNLMDVVKDLKGLQVLSTDQKGIKFYKDAIKKIPTNEYEVLVKVRDKDENVRIFSKSTGDFISELLVLSGSADNFTMLSFVGKIDLNKISKLAKDLDIKGANNLELLGE